MTSPLHLPAYRLPSGQSSGLSQVLARPGSTNPMPTLSRRVGRPSMAQALAPTVRPGLSLLGGQSGRIARPSQIESEPIKPKKERDQILAETFQKLEALPPLTVVKLAISLYSWKQMKALKVMTVENTNLTGSGSVNDDRMGVVNLSQTCGYCHQIDCPGHFGLIKFTDPNDPNKSIPIYNPAFIRELVSILICVCNDCGGLLITEDIMKERGYKRLSFEKRLAALEAHCAGINCVRKKRVVEGGELEACRANKIFVTKDIKEEGLIQYKDQPQGTKSGGKKGRRSDDSDRILVMPITQVANILNLITDADARLLGFPEGSHPRNIIMYGILVPPIIARPEIIEGGSTHYDQLTHMYITIVKKVREGVPTELYKAVRQLIFKTDGKKMIGGSRDFISIVERIQGKTALLRGLLMGKRVNFCGRTVAGPDSSLRFGQVRLPVAWAPILTKKVPVTNTNLEYLSGLLRDGRINYFIQKQTGLRKFYDPRIGGHLRIGDVVERWLQNGDRVVVNRQPTLHRQSMMKYDVVLGHQLTIGLHLSYTSPMNCDFDGDENNAWSPQDFEVEAEVEILLKVENNIMSSEQNRPMMGLVMNGISGAYLLTQEGVRINDRLFEELTQMITDPSNLETLHGRLIKCGVHPRDGKALFSALLPSDFYYNQKGVRIIYGIMVTGRLTKAHVGATNRSIIQDMHKKYRAQRTADFFTDAPWVINKWLIERGFSVGLLDCINLDIDQRTGEEYDRNKRILGQELAKIYVELEAKGVKLEDPIEEAFRQRQINEIVNISNGIGLRLVDEVLDQNNSIGVMTEKGSGSKGANANVGQMMGSVGQQFLYGERLKPTLTGGRRLLPIYDVDDPDPEAHAFIPESFYTGVSPQGLFFLQAGGRPNILDTALKTADTGSMQHRMIKAFENIIIGYDGSIRNTIGTMFAPMYNAGYDIAEMIAIDQPGKPSFSSFVDIKSLMEELNVKRGWLPRDLERLIYARRQELLRNELPQENVLPVSEPIRTPPVSSVGITYDIDAEVIPAGPLIRITKYEKARILGTRATQLSNNAPPLLEIGTEIDPVRIAMQEYDAGILPIYVVRRFADGSIQTVYPTLETI